MKPSEYLELAERCEKASGPDRELDAEIAKAVGYEVIWATIGPNRRREELVQVRTYPGEASPTSRNLRRYSASLDAAMTLVPEGCAPHLDWLHYSNEATARYDCDVQRIANGQTLGSAANVATPALALCAAALKALAKVEL